MFIESFIKVIIVEIKKPFEVIFMDGCVLLVFPYLINLLRTIGPVIKTLVPADLIVGWRHEE